MFRIPRSPMMIRGSKPVSHDRGSFQPSSPSSRQPVTPTFPPFPSNVRRAPTRYAHTLTQHSHVAQQRKPASSSSFGTLTREETMQLTKKINTQQHNNTEPVGTAEREEPARVRMGRLRALQHHARGTRRPVKNVGGARGGEGQQVPTQGGGFGAASCRMEVIGDEHADASH